MATIYQIRQKISDRDYYLSSHAEDEMVDDFLERRDIENAILQGKIEKKMTRDVRGTRYRIEGTTIDFLQKSGTGNRQQATEGDKTKHLQEV